MNLEFDEYMTDDFPDSRLNYDNNEKIVDDFKIKYNYRNLNDKYPSSFYCSFKLFDKFYQFEFKQKSYVFSENTPVWLWDGQFIEKRSSGRVKLD